MAWLRLRDVSTWSPDLNAPGALDKAEKYAAKLPEKWQGLIVAIRMYNSSVPQTEAFYQKLIDEYGETREFTNGMAEYLFHFNPIHGRSSLDAKPWLLRTKELDPNNQEVNIHLADIALVEGDSMLAEKLLNESDISVESWGKYKAISMYLKGDTTQAEIEKVINHDGFKEWYVNIGMVAPEDASHYLDFVSHFSKNIRSTELHDLWLRSQGQLFGKEEDAYESLKKFIEVNSEEPWAPMAQMQRKIIPAVMISGNGYNPLSAHYEEYLDALKEETQPGAYYASAKYALALGRAEEAKVYKKKLKESITNNGPFDRAKYLDFSLEAFEAKSRGEIELCLALIDSAFQYTPGYWPSQTTCMDKIFMLAEIYENKEEYEKSIAYYENIPVSNAYGFSKGFATYKLGQLYEKTGQVNKALSKCNLLIKDYAKCDDQYKPWVQDATERRDRLMAKLL